MTGQRDLGRALVTGAAGFLGAALVARLRGMGHVVTASDVGLADALCDLTDFAQVDRLVGFANCETLFHCGAVSGPMVLADQPLAIWQINAMGTAHVLEAARRHGVRRVVVCSTCDVYGTQTGVLDEDTLPSPVTVYGASKVAAEAAMLGYVREHGLDAVALRLSWLYGPGRRTPTALEKMILSTAKSGDIHFEAVPDEITHYLHVEDAVTGLIKAGQINTLGARIYNISAGQGLAMRHIANVLEALTPNLRITLAPQGMVVQPVTLDIHRAERDLGFSPSVRLDCGLRLYRDALLGPVGA